MGDKSRTPNFDRVASLYRWAEYMALGPILQQTRLCHLGRLQDRRHALLFGDGDGRFLSRLLAENPALHALAIDTSSKMLSLLRKRCSRLDPKRLITLQAEAQHVPIPLGTDLIVTHFFLDCLTQPEVDVLARRIATSIQTGTLWLVSDFAMPANPLLRLPARFYVRSLYLAFKLLTGLQVTTLPDPQSALAAAGFSRLLRHEKLAGLLYSELWAYRPVGPGLHNPAVSPHIHCCMAPEDFASPANPKQPSNDPLPDPEPIAPSLDEPDPGVFHHQPGVLEKQPE